MANSPVACRDTLESRTSYVPLPGRLVGEPRKHAGAPSRQSGGVKPRSGLPSVTLGGTDASASEPLKPVAAADGLGLVPTQGGTSSENSSRSRKKANPEIAPGRAPGPIAPFNVVPTG